MAWSLKAHTQFVSSGGAGGTIAFTTTGADILIAHTSYYSNTDQITLSSALAGAFTALTEHRAGAQISSKIWYIKNPTVGSDTITIGSSGGSVFGVVDLLAYSGSNTTAPFDVENGATSAAGITSLAPGAITPTNDGELIISGVTTNGAGSSFTNAGLTITDQSAYSAGNSLGGAAGYVALGAGTAGAAFTLNSWGWTGSSNPTSASIAAFIAAAGGATGKLFTPSNMDGLGSGGPFFSDRLAA